MVSRVYHRSDKEFNPRSTLLHDREAPHCRKILFADVISTRFSGHTTFGGVAHAAVHGNTGARFRVASSDTLRNLLCLLLMRGDQVPYTEGIRHVFSTSGNSISAKHQQARKERQREPSSCLRVNCVVLAMTCANIVPQTHTYTQIGTCWVSR